MKNIKQLFLASLLILTFNFANAGTLDELQNKISGLDQIYSSLKAQVDAGTMTKDAARIEWKKQIEAIRLEKQSLFETKRNEIKTKIENLKIENTGAREELKADFEKRKIEREAASLEKKAVLEKMKSGSISKDTAKMQLEAIREKEKDSREELRSKADSTRNEIKENRVEVRDEVKDIRGDMGEVRKERVEERKEVKEMRGR